MLIIPPPGADDEARLRDACARRYHRKPADVAVMHAPYRICPLGAHIDHQLGPVSAFATAHGIRLAWVEHDTPEIVINSFGYEGEIRLRGDERQARRHDWADYARGAVNVLNRVVPLERGVSMLIEGRLSEAGLSSSAAVGVGYLSILARANGLCPTPEELIEFDRQIENEFMKVNNGILDPAAIALAEPGSLTIIHCRDRHFERIPQAAEFAFLAIYSGLHEPLATGVKFNNRVAECLEAGAALRQLAGEAGAAPQPLGNTDVETWQRLSPRLSALHRKRATHFFTESERVLAGADAWRAGDGEAFGELMRASCASSINNYETGCPEMIRLVECFNEASGVLGARFCGAGFRGCCIGLVEAGREDAIVEAVIARYLADYPQFEQDVWAIHAAPRAGLHPL